MGVKAAVIAMLEARSALVALVGAKITPRESPINATTPRVVFTRTDTDYTEECMTSTCSRVTATFEIGCFARTSLDAEAVADEVEAAINAARVLLATEAATFAGVNFKAIKKTGRRDVTDFPVYEHDKPVIGDYLTVDLTYEEDC